MPQILILFICSLSLGAFLISAERMKIPSIRLSRNVLAAGKSNRKKTRNIEVLILDLSEKLARYIKLDSYKKRKLTAVLKSADIGLKPEIYMAKAFVKAGLIFTCIFPALFICPIASPIILFATIAVYFKEANAAEEKNRKQKEEVEWELPRFVATLTQELKASRDVLSILETYKKNAGKSLGRELEITIADMKSGSYEAALTRLESRLGSSGLSEVVRGLIGVLRGDNGVVYFQMLSHDLKQLELQRLKTVAMKRPGKIRKYSFIMLACFVVMYLTVMLMQIVKTMGNMF